MRLKKRRCQLFNRFCKLALQLSTCTSLSLWMSLTFIKISAIRPLFGSDTSRAQITVDSLFNRLETLRASHVTFDEQQNAKFFAAKARLFLPAEHVHKDSVVRFAKIGSTGRWDSDKFYLQSEVVEYQMLPVILAFHENNPLASC